MLERKYPAWKTIPLGHVISCFSSFFPLYLPLLKECQFISRKQCKPFSCRKRNCNISFCLSICWFLSNYKSNIWKAPRGLAPPHDFPHQLFVLFHLWPGFSVLTHPAWSQSVAGLVPNLSCCPCIWNISPVEAIESFLCLSSCLNSPAFSCKNYNESDLHFVLSFPSVQTLRTSF